MVVRKAVGKKAAKEPTAAKTPADTRKSATGTTAATEETGTGSGAPANKAAAGRTAASGRTASGGAASGQEDGGGSAATGRRSAAGRTAASKAAAGKEGAPKQGTPQKAAGKKVATKKASAGKAAAGKTPARKTAARRTGAGASAQEAPGTAVPTAPAGPDVGKPPADHATGVKESPAVRAGARKTGARKVGAKKTVAGAAGSGSAASAVPAARNAAEPGVLAVLPGEDPWTPEEVEEARSELLGEVERLTEEIASSEAAVAGLLRDSGDGAGDEADTGSKNITRESELALAANTREMLTQADHALRRLDEGTYGLCEVCGNPIGKARMQAFPRATLCLDDKQRQERR
jgi:RNA polymerase-binding protein DksA